MELLSEVTDIYTEWRAVPPSPAPQKMGTPRGLCPQALPTGPSVGCRAHGRWQKSAHAVPSTEASLPEEMPPPLPGPVTNMGSETPRTSDSMRPKPSQHARTNKYEDEPPKLGLRIVCTTPPPPRGK